MRFSGLQIAASAATFVWISHAAAQVARYEVIDLGVISGGSPLESRAYAINSLHEIAGEVRAANSVMHAAVWLYCPNYGLSARQWHDLSPGAEVNYVGSAHGINDNGLVVGGQTINSLTVTDTRPYVWDLATPANSLGLATFWDDPGRNRYGVGDAWAVNNGSPATIVGAAQSGNGVCASEGFVYQEGAGATALTPLGFSGADTYSEPRDVNDEATPKAAGNSRNCSVASCESPWDAVRWTLSGTPSLTALLDTGASHGARAMGVNDSGHSVGSFHNSSSPCVRNASFWSTTGVSPINLGSAGMSAAEESWAHKLTPLGGGGELTAVGENTTQQAAWRWYSADSGSTWSGVDLNTLISSSCGWSLYIAHDISIDGWIVGEGEVGGELHGFLLKPVQCIGDIADEDCWVDGADLGVLLGAWTPCTPTTPCVDCRADLDLDGYVDGSDLGILMGEWEEECECWQCSAEEEMMSSGDHTELLANLAEAISLMGFASVDEFKDWRTQASVEERAAAEEWLFWYLTSLL